MAVNPPLVSVIISACSRAHFLRRAIESALAQDYPAKEVVVVNDGSMEEAENKIAPWARARGVVWIRQEANCGASVARNAGARVSRGEYLIFLDPYDCFPPGRIASHVELLEACPEAGWTYSDFDILEEDKRDESSLPPLHSEGWVFEDLAAVCMSSNCNLPLNALTFRRMAFERTGGFDETLESGETWGFYLRMARKYPVVYVPKLGTVRRKPGEERAAVFPAREEAAARSRALKRHISASDFSGQGWKGFHRRLSYLYRNAAYLHLRHGRRSEARAAIRPAIRYAPFHPKNYAYLFFTHLLPSAYATARRLKRALWS